MCTGENKVTKLVTQLTVVTSANINGVIRKISIRGN